MQLKEHGLIINHSDTKNAVYNISDDLYWDKSSLDSEINRVFDVCLGCRLCFNLCPSFPALFDAIDHYSNETKNDYERKQQIRN